MPSAQIRHGEGQRQWQAEESSAYTHPLDVQLFADEPLFRLIGDIGGKRVLDVGCGNGYLLRKLRAQGADVIGLDVSGEMIRQAQTSGLCVASADCLPFAPCIFEAAVCGLTINNFPSADMTKRAFREVARVLKPNGIFVITLPHPHTLDVSTRFRRTEWERGQNQGNLVPGEGFKRQIMGRDGSMIPIVNYYWPKDVLTNFAARARFEVDGVVEKRASADEVARYEGELDPIFIEVPFFLVMRFCKR
jgi:SAM-dependent methyltransferase